MKKGRTPFRDWMPWTGYRGWPHDQCGSAFGSGYHRDDGPAVEPGGQESVVEFAGAGQGLGGFAGGNDGRRHGQAGVAKRGLGRGQVAGRHVRIGHDGGLRASGRRLRLLPQERQEVRPDPDDAVGTCGLEPDVHLMHGPWLSLGGLS